MSLFGPSFDKVRLQTHLRMARERIKLIRGKRTNEVKAERKAIAEMVSWHEGTQSTALSLILALSLRSSA